MLNSGSPILHEGGQQAYVGWWDAVTSLAQFEFKNVLKEFVWAKAHVWLYVARSQGDKILKTLSPTLCMHLTQITTPLVLYHGLYVKQVSEALITRDSIQVALKAVVKHCIHISPTTGTASARKYTFEVRETWASCSRLQWAGMYLFLLFHLHSTEADDKWKWGRLGSFITKGPIFEYVCLSLKVNQSNQ